MPPMTPPAHQTPQHTHATIPAPTIEADLAHLIRLCQSMRAESQRIDAQHAAFWRACQARAAARATASIPAP